MSRLFLEIYRKEWFAKVLRDQKKITSEVLLDLQILDVKHGAKHFKGIYDLFFCVVFSFFQPINDLLLDGRRGIFGQLLSGHGELDGNHAAICRGPPSLRKIFFFQSVDNPGDRAGFDHHMIGNFG